VHENNEHHHVASSIQDGTVRMNDISSKALPASSAEPSRSTVQHWLDGFETALRSEVPERIGACFHPDCHWRDELAFTWHFSAAAGQEAISARLAAAQQRTAAHDFRLPVGRMSPRAVMRLGIASVEAIFEFEIRDGAGAGLGRSSAATSSPR